MCDITPEQAAQFSAELNQPEKAKEFLLTSPPRKIQAFIHLIGGGQHNHWFHLARTALDIRLAEDSEVYSRRIFWLTLVVAGLTAVLLALTIALVILTYKLAQNA
jgi:hypothetical protein